MMHILQMLGVIVVSAMFLAEPSVADHHKKDGSIAKAGQKATSENGRDPQASHEAVKQGFC